MYDELIKSLRLCTSDKRGYGCANDCVYGKKHPLNWWCMDYLLKEAADAIEKLEAALILMVLQYCTDEDGTLWHQFMSAGERAFDALGITLETDPQVLWDRLEKLEAKEGE